MERLVNIEPDDSKEKEALILKHEYPFRLATFQDVHIGSQMALWHEDIMDRYGNRIVPNEGQKILWSYLEHYIGVLKKLKIKVLLCPGDMIAGTNPKEYGRYMLPIDLNSQVEACAWIINYIAERVPSLEQVMLWRGTPYHGSRDVELIEMLETILYKDYGIQATYNGPYSYLVFERDGKKKVFWIGHPATEAVVYPETAMGRDIMFFQQKYGEGKLPKVDLIIRAHKHEYIELHKASMREILLPCWQFFVPFDRAVKWYPKYQPDIGGVTILLDEELRIRPWHWIYPNIVDPLRFIKIKADGKVFLTRLGRA